MFPDTAKKYEVFVLRCEGILRHFRQLLINPATTFLLLAAVAASAQTMDDASTLPAGSPAVPVAVLKSVRYVKEANGPAIEIVSSWPVVPSIHLIDNPWRLMIDLPNARVGKVNKEMSVKKEYVTEIRSDQYQERPPITRIVLDLIAPYGATWDSAGNRLMVRLKPPNDPTASRTVTKAPQVMALSRQPQPAVIPVTSGSGPISLAGGALAAGSTISATEQTAVLSLQRGGEIRVCPRTTVSVNASKNSSELMVSLSTGALETHYRSDATADSVMTPDFRILFPGPGEFHYAISIQSNGDTCVRGLSGNASPVIVSELLGDRTYQVKPYEQAVFRGGQIDHLDANVPLECGCPPPAPAQLLAGVQNRPLTAMPSNAVLGQATPKPANAPNTVLAAAAAPAPVLPAPAEPASPANPPASDAAPAAAPATPNSEAPTPAPASSTASNDVAPSAPSTATPPPPPPATTTLSAGPEIAPPPASKPGEVVTVDAPIVFSAKSRKAGTTPPPPVLGESASAPARSLPAGATIDTRVQPPPKARKRKKSDAEPAPVADPVSPVSNQASAQTQPPAPPQKPAPQPKTGFFHKLKGFFGSIFK